MIYELIQNLHLLTMKLICLFNLKLIYILKYKTTNIRSGICINQSYQAGN